MRGAGIWLLICVWSLTHDWCGELNVFAAASLTDVLKEICRDYPKQTGTKVIFNFAPSSTLARQIEEGAPADLFLSADEAKMDALEKQGLIEHSTRRSLLSNSLVIITGLEGKLSFNSAADLKKAGRIAIAQPQIVPAGIYAREYLEQLGLWDALRDSIIPVENVRGALAAVESGNADAAIVYKTDAAISKRVKVAYEVPRPSGPKISYPVAVIASSKNREAALDLERQLASPRARAIFEKFGFIVLR
jgi:molybdate transport system substrate-binding protein